MNSTAPSYHPRCDVCHAELRLDQALEPVSDTELEDEDKVIEVPDDSEDDEFDVDSYDCGSVASSDLSSPEKQQRQLQLPSLVNNLFYFKEKKTWDRIRQISAKTLTIGLCIVCSNPISKLR